MRVRRVLRWGSFSLALVAGFVLVWAAAARAVAALEPARNPMGLDLIPALRAFQRQMQGDPAALRVAVVGDSMLDATDVRYSVSHGVARALPRYLDDGLPKAVHAMAWPGWGPSAQFCLADEIVRARPDLVALELNLRGLGPWPLGDLAFPEVAGWLPARRLPRAAGMSLSYARMTMDRFLFYGLVVASGHEGEWARLAGFQAQVWNLREPLEALVDRRAGLDVRVRRIAFEAAERFRRTLEPGEQRATRATLERALGNALAGIEPGHTRLEPLRATLDVFREAHVPTLVWVAPINVQHLAREGFPLDGLGRTLRVLRALAQAHGAAFADLHAGFPDAAFADAADHLASSGPKAPTMQLGDRLAAAIARVASVRRAEAR